MIKFPVSENSMVFIIEPGNIKRLKSGKPLQLALPNGSSALLCYTPDANAFLDRIKPGMHMPENHKENFESGFMLYPEELDKYLKECLELPEVDR